jgi:hypothetical protein
MKESLEARENDNASPILNSRKRDSNHTNIVTCSTLYQATRSRHSNSNSLAILSKYSSDVADDVSDDWLDLEAVGNAVGGNLSVM